MKWFRVGTSGPSIGLFATLFLISAVPASAGDAPPNAGAPPASRPTLTASDSGEQIAFPRGVKVSRLGVVNIDGLTFGIVHFNDHWQAVSQTQGAVAPADKSPVRKTGRFDLTGKFRVAGQHFDIAERVRAVGSNDLTYECDLTQDAGVPTGLLALQVELPARLYLNQQLIIDGVPVTLADSPKKDLVKGKPDVGSVKLATVNGVLAIAAPQDGSFDLHIQDNRPYGVDAFVVQFLFSSHDGNVKESHLDLSIGYTPNGDPTAASK